VPSGTTVENASLEPSPATEAEAVPFARWLHKGESNSNQALNLLYAPPPSFSYQLISILSESTRARCLTELQTVALQDLTRFRNLIQPGIAFMSKESLGFDPREAFLAMGENDRINPLTTAYATPVDRSDLEHSLFHHKPTAAMALAGLTVLGCFNLGHE
jgi:hypothetical protein